MNQLAKLQLQIKKQADPEKGQILQKFFKTGKGEYGYGDVFVGLTVPKSRSIAKNYTGFSIIDLSKILNSQIHEERLIALFILIEKYRKSDYKAKKEIVDFYLSHTAAINNWDLVDLSSDKILGDYLLHFSENGKKFPNNGSNILIKLAKSQSLWERRIAVIATFAFIKAGKYELTFKTAEILLKDKEDLIHKAVGWMLREVGKRISIEIEEEFLKKHYLVMPRTMLRYAIEKFPEEKRQNYLNGCI